MNNYKIRVNNEAESREAQELFFELGYKHKWDGAVVKESWNKARFVYAEDKILWSGNCSDDFAECNFQELTLPQLRDLVVLHRNDVMDATHVGKSGSEYYVTEEEVYFFDGMEWVLKDVDVSNLKPIQKPQLEQGLISGADALRAIADGKEVEACVTLRLKKDEWHWFNAKSLTIDEIEHEETQGMPDGTDVRKIVFRLKPRTVKLEIEVPAPFEPKYGEEYWFLCLNVKDRYASTENQNLTCDRYRIDFGVYRTEAEIKIVVEQLCKLKEHSK